jgi:hypothetical protein
VQRVHLQLHYETAPFKKVCTKFRNKNSYNPNQTCLFLWYVPVLNFGSKNCNKSEAETGSERQYLIQRAELKLKCGTWIFKSQRSIRRLNNVKRSDADRTGQCCLIVWRTELQIENYWDMNDWSHFSALCYKRKAMNKYPSITPHCIRVRLLNWIKLRDTHISTGLLCHRGHRVLSQYRLTLRFINAQINPDGCR